MGIFKEEEDTIKSRRKIRPCRTVSWKSGMISNGEEVTLRGQRRGKKNIEEEPQRTNTPSAEGIKDCSPVYRRKQKGSLVTPTRLRFDFAHFQAMTPEELEKVGESGKMKRFRRDPVAVTDIMDTEGSKEIRRDGSVR